MRMYVQPALGCKAINAYKTVLNPDSKAQEHLSKNGWFPTSNGHITVIDDVEYFLVEEQYVYCAHIENEFDWGEGRRTGSYLFCSAKIWHSQKRELLRPQF